MFFSERKIKRVRYKRGRESNIKRVRKKEVER
jgi:hypothetical protein